MEREQAIKFMRDLLKLMVEKKGSDLFITVGFPPAMKAQGKMTPVSKTPLTADNTKAMCYAIMNDRQLKEYESTVHLVSVRCPISGTCEKFSLGPGRPQTASPNRSVWSVVHFWRRRRRRIGD